MKDLVRIIRQESYEYSDPLTDFVRALHINFDFEESQKQLSAAEQILKEDFFLASSTEDFVDAARHLISESYCKIHQRIDIRYG
jgi:translation initiation factor 3 subunit E